MSADGRDLIGGVTAASVGTDLFARELESQHVSVQQLAWAPAPEQHTQTLRKLVPVAGRIHEANDEAVRRLEEAAPALVGAGTRSDLLPDVDVGTFLHAGPPIAWHDMCGAMRGAVVGAILFEGLADSPEEARRKADRGEFRFLPNHEHGAVAPMSGVISASMPMWRVENQRTGNRAVSTINEGMGRVLRFGAFHPEHIDHLRWLRDRLLPAVIAVLEAVGPIDVGGILAQALQMGDECHNRHKAASALFFRELTPPLFSVAVPSADAAAVAGYMAVNEIFFLNVAMAAAKASLDAASGIVGSSIVTAMTRNGVEFGVRVSGTGNRWFTAPAAVVDGVYFSGFGPEDANRDLGDSAIMETMGLGGFAMAASPASVQVVGGTAETAIAMTRDMYDITWSESPRFAIPSLGFRGTPLGIDAREVLHARTPPIINTGIAHREAGVGQIGAGVSRPPFEPFAQALESLAPALMPYNAPP
jgi:hypothetical protein